MRPCVGREEHWHQSTPRGKVSLGQTAHWHSEYTLQNDHIDRHIARPPPDLRQVYTPKTPKRPTSGHTDSSDVPVYMVFLQGVLTVPVGCLAK